MAKVNFEGRREKREGKKRQPTDDKLSHNRYYQNIV